MRSCHFCDIVVCRGDAYGFDALSPGDLFHASSQFDPAGYRPARFDERAKRCLWRLGCRCTGICRPAAGDSHTDSPGDQRPDGFPEMDARIPLSLCFCPGLDGRSLRDNRQTAGAQIRFVEETVLHDRLDSRCWSRRHRVDHDRWHDLHQQFGHQLDDQLRSTGDAHSGQSRNG